MPRPGPRPRRCRRLESAVPRLRQVPRSEIKHKTILRIYELLFGDRCPVAKPGTSTGSRGDWWTTAALLSGLLLVLSGACLLIGFLTPIVSVLAGVACIASTISLLPPPPVNLFDGALVSLDMAAMAVAVALLGPGAFSLDARLFGRREIVIPSSPRESKS